MIGDIVVHYGQEIRGHHCKRPPAQSASLSLSPTSQTDISNSCLFKPVQYLTINCLLTDNASRQWLRSARRCLLMVPHHRRSTLGRQAFSVAGPAVWNLLPDQLRDSGCTESASRKSLKTFFFNQY